jgi:hypothetical protein
MRRLNTCPEICSGTTPPCLGIMLHGDVPVTNISELRSQRERTQQAENQKRRSPGEKENDSIAQNPLRAIAGYRKTDCAGSAREESFGWLAWQAGPAYRGPGIEGSSAQRAGRFARHAFRSFAGMVGAQFPIALVKDCIDDASTPSKNRFPAPVGRPFAPTPPPGLRSSAASRCREMRCPALAGTPGRHRCSTFGFTSNPRATSAIDTPCSSRRTAANLNSCVNCLRDKPMTQFSIR